MHMETGYWPHSWDCSHRGYLNSPFLSQAFVRPGLN